MTVLCRGTNVDDNFPRCFDRFIIDYLGVVDNQSELGGRSPVSDTHFKFLHQGKYLSPRLEVNFLRLSGEVGALGERLILIIF